MKDFKTIILDTLGSIEWMYEANENGEYDPYALYKGGKCEIDSVFHKAFADALIEWREERVSNWKNWVTTGTMTNPSGVTVPLPLSKSTCTFINDPMDITLQTDIRLAFYLQDPNMKFQHFKVFQAIYNWLLGCNTVIFMDGSENGVINVTPLVVNASMLLTNASVMESELATACLKDGFSKEDYWDIFGRYLDMSLTTSVQSPVMMTGMMKGNLVNAICTPVL